MQNSAFAHVTKKLLSVGSRAGCPNTGAPTFSTKRGRSEILLACEMPVRRAEQEPHWTTAPSVGGRLQSARYLGSCSRPPVRLALIPSVRSRVGQSGSGWPCPRWMGLRDRRSHASPAWHHRHEGECCDKSRSGRRGAADAVARIRRLLVGRLFACGLLVLMGVTWIGHVLAEAGIVTDRAGADGAPCRARFYAAGHRSSPADECSTARSLEGRRDGAGCRLRRLGGPDCLHLQPRAPIHGSPSPRWCLRRWG